MLEKRDSVSRGESMNFNERRTESKDLRGYNGAGGGPKGGAQMIENFGGTVIYFSWAYTC